LYRGFLAARRKETRFPHVDLEDASSELPAVPSATISRLDMAEMLAALSQLDEIYQEPVALFYLQDYSYIEIAEVLGLPLGTVKSRLARGIGQLKQLLTTGK
jgi:RNA polymerase sigma-70 factor, ECF subfamily